MIVDDKIFIVTGGGSGLGEATARVLHEAGARLAIFDRDDARGHAVATDLGGVHYALDVSDSEAVEHAVRDVAEHYGALHGAINCAGVGIATRVLGKNGPHALDAFHQVLLINVVGTFNVTRWVAWHMKAMPADPKGERGVIIQTASAAAFEGQIGQAAYAASKGAIVSMTLPIARELARYGIRVVSIAPGIFDTPMLGLLSDEIRRSLGEQVPFPSRLGDPQEFGLLARHIIENPMLNGEVIRLDGALRMAPH